MSGREVKIVDSAQSSIDGGPISSLGPGDQWTVGV
jgi:hypothetical protein